MMTANVFLDFGEAFAVNNATGNQEFAGFRELWAETNGVAATSSWNSRAPANISASLLDSLERLQVDYNADGSVDNADVAVLGNDVADLVRRTFEPFNVDVQIVTSTDHQDVRDHLAQSASNDVYVFVGGKAGTYDADGDPADFGIAWIDQGNSRDIVAFAAAEELLNLAYNTIDSDTESSPTIMSRTVNALASTSAHEAAHAFGLAHLANTTAKTGESDIISPTATRRVSIPIATRGFTFNSDAGPQNSYQTLADALGTKLTAPAYVTGTGADDMIDIVAIDNNLAQVNVDSTYSTGPNVADTTVTTSYTVDITHGILVEAGNGNDTVSVTGLTVPVEIRGGAGNDTLASSLGNDRLQGDEGNDTLQGDLGNDAYAFDGPLAWDFGDDTIEESGGYDTLDLWNFQSSTNPIDLDDHEWQKVDDSKIPAHSPIFELLRDPLLKIRFDDTNANSKIENVIGGRTFAVANYGPDKTWTSQDRYLRQLADVNGDGRDDIVGFSHHGAYVSLSNGTSFDAAEKWVGTFGPKNGWTSQSEYPRVMADVNGDGMKDIVGFGHAGAYVSLSTGSSFTSAELWIDTFGKSNGWRNQNAYPRYLADVNDDGLQDIVGFANSGTYVALSTGSSFADAERWVDSYNTNNGWHSHDSHPRFMADVDGDGLQDIVGFGNAGTYVSISTGENFSSPQLWVDNYGQDGNLTSQNTYPRYLADVNGDGLDDVVGFGHLGAYVSTSTGSSFAQPELWVDNYGTAKGWHSQDAYPRYMTDVNGDGLQDIVGFGYHGAYYSVSTGDSFEQPQLQVDKYGFKNGWSSQSNDLRVLADVNGDGASDIVGFDDNGVFVYGNRAEPAPLIAEWDGIFPAPQPRQPLAPHGNSKGGVGESRASSDLDTDGDVDGADFLAWQRGFRTPAHFATISDGDADGDSDVDSEDLSLWKTQFGTDAPLVDVGLIDKTPSDPKPSSLSSLSASPMDVALTMEWEDLMEKQDPEDSPSEYTATDKVAPTRFASIHPSQRGPAAPAPRNASTIAASEEAVNRPGNDDTRWLTDPMLERIFG